MVSKRKCYTVSLLKKIFLFSLSLSLSISTYPLRNEQIQYLAAKFVLFQNYMVEMMEWHKHYDEKIIVLEK